jgi:hypothetical protein
MSSWYTTLTYRIRSVVAWQYYLVLSIKESDNGKTVCNPTLEVDSSTQHGSRICTHVGYEHDGYLLRPSPHLSLMVDLVAEEPNV